MSCNDSIYIGFVTKKEIITHLEQYGLKTEEHLRPIKDLRDTQCLRSELIEYYQDLFDKHDEQHEEHHETTFIDDQNDSLYDENYSDLDNSETLNDTLAEMEAFMSKGTNYDFEEYTPAERESSFCPPISSTNAELSEKSHDSPIYYAPENSPQSELGYLASNSNSTSENSNSIKYHQNITNFVNNSPKVSELKLEKLNFNTPEKKHEIFSPKNITNQISTKKFTPEGLKSSKSTKENVNPIFKTPILPKTKPSNFNHIVSPISRYISETPTVPLFQKVVQKTIPFSEHKFKTPKKSSRNFKELPEVSYRPSKLQQISFEARASPLPKSVDRYITKPLRPEIIKHKGRINVKNEFEEYCESFPIDLVKVEDMSTFIDLETSRITEMSVIISSEAKFSSELRK